MSRRSLVRVGYDLCKSRGRGRTHANPDSLQPGNHGQPNAADRVAFGLRLLRQRIQANISIGVSQVLDVPRFAWRDAGLTTDQALSSFDRLSAELVASVVTGARSEWSKFSTKALIVEGGSTDATTSNACVSVKAFGSACGT